MSDRLFEARSIDKTHISGFLPLLTSNTIRRHHDDSRYAVVHAGYGWLSGK